MKRISIGIDLDHVIRDINKQIVKYYQKEFDEVFDLDDIDYSEDVMNTVCRFKNNKEKCIFLYEEYPLEIFGHAGQIERTLSRDLNAWIEKLGNQEEYDVDIFFYSMKEYNITIQSSYFFISKIGSRVRCTVFPKNFDELSRFGDVFITSYPDNAKEIKKRKKNVILIKTKFNEGSEKYSDLKYDSFREFLNDENKLDKISNLREEWKKAKKKNSLLTLMKSWLSYLRMMMKE